MLDPDLPKEKDAYYMNLNMVSMKLNLKKILEKKERKVQKR